MRDVVARRGEWFDDLRVRQLMMSEVGDEASFWVSVQLSTVAFATALNLIGAWQGYPLEVLRARTSDYPRLRLEHPRTVEP